jgi:hypothetical protein
MTVASPPSSEIPVLLLLFRRPDTTRRILARLRQLRPSRLVVVADGPRSEVPEEAGLCRAVREELRGIDWPCRLEKLFAEANLGIAASLELGMGHVFRRHDRVIVLEDDCLPDPSFFPYCAELLERYAEVERVMAIAGSNLGIGPGPEGGSYAFSRYQVLWGWATWKRAWRHQDRAMGHWPECSAAAWLDTLLETPQARRYWAYHFRTNHRTAENWDYAWTFNCWRHDGLCIHPAVNLVHNLGFREDATHTAIRSSPRAELEAHSMSLPLVHPPTVMRDVARDRRIEAQCYSGPEFLAPLFRSIRHHLHPPGPHS